MWSLTACECGINEENVNPMILQIIVIVLLAALIFATICSMWVDSFTIGRLHEYIEQLRSQIEWLEYRQECLMIGEGESDTPEDQEPMSVYWGGEPYQGYPERKDIHAHHEDAHNEYSPRHALVDDDGDDGVGEGGGKN